MENDKQKYMALHGYTGALDILHKDIVDYLRMNKQNITESDFPFGTITWKNLLTRGYITQKTKRQEQEHVIKLANLLHKRNKLLHKYFTFIITYDCNFRCPYCYEANLSNHGLNWSKKKFTKEMVDKAYRAIDIIENRRDYRSNTILLYGGEPLLAENREIIEYIIQTGTKKGFVFNAITTGYELETYLDLIGDDKIRFLQITLDGTAEHHNIRRQHYQHKKTFDKIFENILLALSRNIRIVVRINTDEHTINDIANLKKMFRDRGILNHPKLFIQSALLVDYIHSNASTEVKNKYDIENDLKYIQYTDFVSQHRIKNLDVQFDDRGTYKLLNDAIRYHQPLHLKSTYCAAHHGSYILDPYGNIFGCLENIGFPNARIGTYSTEQVNWTPLKEQWHWRNSGRIEKCSKCPYVFMCKSGCLTQVLKRGGDFNNSQCEGYGQILTSIANAIYDKLFLQ